MNRKIGFNPCVPAILQRPQQAVGANWESYEFGWQWRFDSLSGFDKPNSCTPEGTTCFCKSALSAILFVVLGVIAACSSPDRNWSSNSRPTPPKEAIDAVLSEIEECKGKRECRDFKLICSSRIDLTTAEKANEMQDKWCIRYQLIYRSKEEKDAAWSDSVKAYFISHQSGIWEVSREYFDYVCPCD